MGNQQPKTYPSSRDSNKPPPRPKKPAHLKGARLKGVSLEANNSQEIPWTESIDQCPLQIEPEPCLYETVDLHDIASDSMPISDLIEEFGAQLPLRFRVSESLYGICEESSLLDGQLLNVLFEKETKVIVTRASWGAEYIVPLNSSFHFSILYNPLGKIETAKVGYNFTSVSDIMDAHPIPLAVVVTRAFQCKSSSIDEGQILLVKDIMINENGKRKLKCIAVPTSFVLLLDEDIEGCFSTKTYDLKVCLGDVIEHLTLPVEVLIDGATDKDFQLPLHATVESYTLVDQRIEKSVIVSAKSTQVPSKTDLIEILMSIPIEVQLVKISKQQLQILRQETQSIFDNFHPSKLTKLIVDSFSSINYIQTKLFKCVPQDDSWMTGIKLFPPQPPSTSFEFCYDDDDNDYVEMNVGDSTEDNLSVPANPTTTSLSEPSSIKSRDIPMPLPPRRNHFEIADSCVLIPDLSATDVTHSLLSHELNKLESTPVNTRVDLDQSKSDPVPYLIAREESGGEISHEKPYDYVKFSHNCQNTIEQLRQQLVNVETADKNTSDLLQRGMCCKAV